MTTSISTNYRELLPHEIDQVAAECAQAWQDPAIPARQYEIVKAELETFRNGGAVAPYDALVKCLRRLLAEINKPETKLLDVGASTGSYKAVLEMSGQSYAYTGLDFSPAFKALAEKLYPGIDFEVGDARALPFHDDEFDIVLNSAVIMHTREYEQVIRETARVASKYAIFHRTPIRGSTTFWRKEAYGVPVLEIHFGEHELLWIFAKYGLHPIHVETVFTDGEFSHRSYVLEKPEHLMHIQV